MVTQHLDVLIVGAGLSGIDAAYWLQRRSPGRSWQIFESRDAIGGTWDLFRYPGIRSDSDMTTLGFPFRPWRGEKSIADGADIRDYIRDTATQFGIDQEVRLRHRVTSAAWSTNEARWLVHYEADGEPKTVTCGFLYMCSGYYDYAEAYEPTWPEMETFGGRIVHPQFWPDNLDVTGKKVVVVGSGATAVTLVPALVAKGAAHVTMLQRSPTYIVSAPARDKQAEALRRRLPARLADSAVRWKNIGFGIFFYNLARKNPEAVKAKIAAGQRHALGPDYDMAGHFTPRYNPWDQRLCLVPDGDLFKALRAGSASIATDQIERFTTTGLQLSSDRAIEADIIVTATGLKMKMMGGAPLTVDGKLVDPGTRLLYKGSMLDGVPNFAFALGYTNASWTLKCDLTARFVSKIVNYMTSRKLSVVRPHSAAEEHLDAPVLDLTSGYIQRSAALLPRQGVKAPWKVHQNYVRDMLAFRTGRMRDGALQFEKAPNRKRKAA